MGRPVPRLPRAVERDVAHVFSRWSDYFRELSSEGFALLLILEALRTKTNKSERFHFAHLAADLGVSANTLRRWLSKLRHAGLLTTRFVPGSHSTEAYFRLHLPAAAKRGSLRSRERDDASAPRRLGQRR